MRKTSFIAIVGRPNVGKSTLLNAILGEKIAIVSSKPQTTRNRITGIYTKDENQIVFIDTPGFQKPRWRRPPSTGLPCGNLWPRRGPKRGLW